MKNKEIIIEIQCPVSGCGKKKKITLPSYIFENKKYGTCNIQIQEEK